VRERAVRILFILERVLVIVDLDAAQQRADLAGEGGGEIKNRKHNQRENMRVFMFGER
jgi:hypothetical protein